MTDTVQTPAPHPSADVVPGGTELDDVAGARVGQQAPQTAERWRGKRRGAGTVLMTYIGTHVDRLDAWERDLRHDRPDAVHQIRVSARRIRSALRTYRPLLDSPRTDQLVDELQWLGRALAGDRDAEVLEERITSALEELPPELLLGPVQAQVTRHFAARRAEARAATIEVVEGDRFSALRDELHRLLVDPPLSGPYARKADAVLPAMAGRTVRKLGRRMDAAVEALASESGGRDSDEPIHRARKTGKQVRYAVEVLRPIEGKVGERANAFRRRLKGLQDELGAHQDTVVARETLRELGARAGAQNQNGFTFGLLYGRDEIRAREIEARLPQTWARVGAAKHRRWMR